MEWILGTWFQSPPRQREVALATGRPLRLVRSHGHRVTCERGCVWITASGEPGDIFLFAGQTWRIPGQGLVLVEAETEAVVTLDG